jgi:hypothetical protein
MEISHNDKTRTTKETSLDNTREMVIMDITIITTIMHRIRIWEQEALIRITTT